MPGDTPRIYWDANVLLSYVEGREDRLSVIDEVLTRAERGDIELLTSVLSRVEVAYSGDDKEQRDARADDIEQLWTPASPVMVHEFHELIADKARTLIRGARERDRGLKPMDAIHIATAMHVVADELHTYDEPLWDYSNEAGIPIHAPTNPQERLGPEN